MTKHFLVVYDYGMGGLWAIVKARSQEDIVQEYPMLTVFQERPSWMTEQHYARIATNQTLDIDDPPSGWLAEAVRENGPNQ